MFNLRNSTHRMKKTRFLLLFALVAALLFACKKDDETPRTKTELLTARTWLINEALAANSIGTVTIYRKGNAANAEDLSLFRLTLSSNGTYRLVDTDGDSGNGTWKFTDNETKLNLDDGDALWEVLTLTETNFDARYTDTEDIQPVLVTLKMIPQ